jgi:hypothetical protein
MTDKFKNLLTLLKDKSSRWSVDNDGHLIFKISGFSKSGEASLFEKDDGTIICLTRYDEVDVVESYDDVVHVAFSWYRRYSDRDVFSNPPHEWVKDFLRLGLLKEEKKTVYTLS